MPTVQITLETIAARLQHAGVHSPRVDAEWLLEHVLGWSRSRLTLEAQSELAPAILDQLEPLVQRRETREPLQWILGSTEFYGLELRVQPGVLIPRPETERLVELVLKHVRGPTRVLDIGTGTGAIALAIKHERPEAHVFATDINPVAVELTLENAKRLGIQLDVRLGSLLGEFAGPFDVIVSNPPYLLDADHDALEPEVQREPREALFAGSDGLEVARAIVAVARETLVPGGLLALELDPRNVHVLARALEETGWDGVRVASDLAGRERFLLAGGRDESRPHGTSR